MAPHGDVGASGGGGDPRFRRDDGGAAASDPGFRRDDTDDAAPGELTRAELIALDRAGGLYDELAWYDDDGPDDVPPEARAPEAARAAVTEPWDAGFTHGVPGAAGCGFAGGGMIDRMLPGRHLAGFTGDALAAGLVRLNDDELIGFIGAARRNASWAQALELTAVAELEGRRAGADGRPGEHVAAEVAASLTLTGRAAEALLALAGGIARLRQVPAALAAGVIDLPRAAVFARELLPLDDDLAARAEALVMPRAAGLTTGQLAAALRRAVCAVDPAASERRREQAEKEARVEAWAEPGRGTAALAGRDLPTAEAIAADKRITAAARWLKAHGVDGGMDWLRSRAYMAFLNGYGLDDVLADLLARSDTGSVHEQEAGSGDGDPGGTGTRTPERARHRSEADAAGSPADRTPDTGAARTSGGSAVPADGARVPPTPADSPVPPRPARSPVPPGLADSPVPPGLAALTGSVNLIMPALAWLGLSDAPGEITGTPAGGPADAVTCRDLADALAARADARWCLTLTDSAGRAVAHGCARRSPGATNGPGRTGDPGSPDGPGRPGGPGSHGGPGDPGDPGDPGSPGRPGGPGSHGGPGSRGGPLARAGPGPPDPLGWLRSIPLIPVERGDCGHRLEVPGYRPSPLLRHRVKTRSPRCSFPGCRRPAKACDDDHTLAWHEGGRTCECNLSPLCRMHHRAKQAAGWHLTQPRPGTLVWTLPSGRAYTTEPEPYLA